MYPYHDKNSTDRPEDGLGRCRARDLLCKIQTFDEDIQRRDSEVPSTFLFMGLGLHRGSWKETAWHAGCETGPDPIYRDERPFCHGTPRANSHLET